MTRKLICNAQGFFGIALFIAVPTVFIATSAPAQMTSSGQPSAQRNNPSVQRDRAELPQDLTVRSGNGPEVSESRLQGNRAASFAQDSGDPLYLPAVLYPSGWATAVALGDVNLDGKLDLVVANFLCYGCGPKNYSPTVSVLLGNGDGTFQPAVVYSAGANQSGTLSVAIADVNGDGKPDVVVTTETNLSEGDGSAAVLLGNGDGTFQPAVNYDSGGYGTVSAAVADLNGNGKLDLIVANGCGGGIDCSTAVGILLGNGDGTFQPVTTYGSTVGGAASVAVGDVNGDGEPDLLVAYAWDCADCQTGSTAVLLNNGDGTFYPGASYPQVGGGFVTVADVNRDGKLDLLVTAACPNGGECDSGTVGVLLGNGDGTFQPQVLYDSGGSQASSVVVADINGDGNPDLLVTNGCPYFSYTNCEIGTLGVLLGNGDGTFQTVITFPTGAVYASSVAGGDVNGDGRVDAVVANMCGNSACNEEGGVSVFLNDTGPHHSTSTTLTSSANPSLAGIPVTFTARVSSGSGTVSGTVVFFDGSTSIGSAVLSSGIASITISSLAVGSHSITAAYQVSLKYSGSTSAPLTQIVNLATTTTVLSSSQNPAGVHQEVVYSATVTTQDGGSASGTVTFQDGGATIAVVTLSRNQAACTEFYKTVGIHAMTATYSGDGDNSASTSATLTEDIDGVSKTKLTTSQSPSFVGQPVTFTATVTSPYGAIPDGELVTFYDPSTAIGTGTTVSGVATFTTSSLPAKTYSIKGTYAGDAMFKPSSGTVKQVVDKYPTTTTLTSSPNPSDDGQAVTLTATVTSAGPTPTGKVDFRDGTKSLGTRTLTSAVATLTTSKLAVGAHPITAEYLGDANSGVSTSPVLDQVVQ
jgi:hypothetical protein